ncbi:MAG: aspartate carbamoyltransferase catalytic subunit [Chloroflexota bacterium]|nr:aspartate carbamoyltransferase catalytic subunit [Dehalococcoidia bacterium]MDW8253232.1 aspartate carbamoyltransferase catalytic subunit [Chloroflexota bacterium]
MSPPAPFPWPPRPLPEGPRRHLLDLDDFDRAEIETYLATAEAMREILRRATPKTPALTGRTIVNLFFEESTRTRVSFEIAGKRLNADVVNVSAAGSSVQKGESLVNTVRTLDAAGADIIVLRHPAAGAAHLAAAHVRGSVINAGDGWHAHPTQALLDLLTIRDAFGRVDGVRVVIVGDILHSRVARSNLWGLTTMGAVVTVCGPPTLLPSALPAGLPAPVRVEHNLDRAIEGAEVVMALRLQRERMAAGRLPSLREYSRLYQINDARLARAQPDVLVLHPGPMNEGVEIDTATAHGQRSAIEDQVTNGVAVRMAVLHLLSGGAPASRTPEAATRRA